MSDRLVTVSTFFSLTEASLARNTLDAAGIRCALEDDDNSVQYWQMAGASQGYRLLVAEDDAERALKALAEEDAEEAESPPIESFTADPPEPEERSPNTREDSASRAFLCAVFGIILVPLQFYTAYLVMDAWSSEEPLRPVHRRALWWATAIILVYAAVVLLYFVMLAASFGESRW